MSTLLELSRYPSQRVWFGEMVAKLHLDWREAMTYSTRIRHHLLSHQMVMGGRYRSTQLPVALLLAALVLLLTPIAWAKTEVLTLRWSEVGAAVAGGEATIVLSQGTRLTGSVSEVRAA